MAKGDKRPVVMGAEKGKGGGVGTLDETGRQPAAQTSLHVAQHRTGGADPLTPEGIGAARETHTHTTREVSDFPSAMPPTAHASTHGSGGSDPVTPASIGAAAAGHGHSMADVTIADDNDSAALYRIGVEGGKLYIQVK